MIHDSMKCYCVGTVCTLWNHDHGLMSDVEVFVLFDMANYYRAYVVTIYMSSSVVNERDRFTL
jgi:hypothetical protein